MVLDPILFQVSCYFLLFVLLKEVDQQSKKSGLCGLLNTNVIDIDGLFVLILFICCCAKAATFPPFKTLP